MESFYDDDDLALSIPEMPSSSLPKPKLRRLKKAVSPSLLQPLAVVPDVPSMPISAAAHDPTEILASSSDGMDNVGFDKERVSEPDRDPLLAFRSNEERDGDPSMPDIEVDKVRENFEDKVVAEELKKEKRVKRRLSLEDDDEDLNKRKTKKGRSRKVSGPERKPKESVREIKRLEKTRMAELEHLHAESQRLLRETRDASFKPVQLIQKPMSSVLEKIRLRKLELSKRCNLVSSIPSGVDTDCPHKTDCSSNAVNHQSDTKETDKNAKAFDAGFKGTCQNPTNDTQAYKTSSQISIGDDDLLNVQEASRPPCPPSSSLNIDCPGNDGGAASSGDCDISSSEEESDKENIGPSACNVVNMDSSPKHGLVKAFLDDEAEEEDDSDCDLLRFPDIEEEDEIDEQELNDLIAIGYEEVLKDQEKRNELHQKWLEQQDATETDNVLQRLKCGHGHRKPAFLHGDYDNYDGSDDDNEGNDSDDSGDDEAVDKNPIDTSHQSLKKAKQMISHMFTDANDVYIPSDEEETENNLIRHHILKQHEAPSIVSPLEDETSREFFGLIKKLNIASVSKKRAKTSASLFDSLGLSASCNSASKSSFLKRGCNSLPATHKQGGSTSIRAYIFGRDDSNSRNNITTSETNSDTAQNGSSSAKNSKTEKVSGSQQMKSSIINKRKVEEAHSETASLFNILRQSSVQFDKKLDSKACDGSHVISESQAAYKFSAFKLRRNSKMDSRS